MDARLLVGGALAVTALAAPLFLHKPGAVHATGPFAAQDDADGTAADAAAADATPGDTAAPAGDLAAAGGGRSSLDIGPAVVPLIVEIKAEPDGSEYATVIGANVSIQTICNEIAEESNRIVFGFRTDERDLSSPLVTVDLRNRPLEEVLEYVLGTAGLVAELSRDVLNVRLDTTNEDGDALLLRALAGYGRASYAYPDHDLAAAARLAQGEIEERRGLDQAALSHYQLLIESHPASPLVLDAFMRSGDLLQRMGEWARAIDQYRYVSEISPEDLEASDDEVAPLDRYVQEAKLEIARCNLELGRSDFALLILNVLEREHPALDRVQVMARATLRALCYLELGSYIEALKVLDELERGFVTEDVAHLALEIRARCFDGMDLRKEAAKAWLFHARIAPEPQRSLSYERASELFLALEEYAGVMLVAGEVRHHDVDADVAADERLARAALGLEYDLNADNSTAAERVDAADVAASTEDWDEVTILLGPLFGELELAPEPLRAQIALGWAQALYSTEGIDAAITALRDARQVFDRLQPEDTPRLDQKAAELFESAGNFDAAYEAYEGNY